VRTASVHVYLVSIQGSLFIPFGLQGLALSPGLTGKALPPLHLPLTPPAFMTQPLMQTDRCHTDLNDKSCSCNQKMIQSTRQMICGISADIFAFLYIMHCSKHRHGQEGVLQAQMPSSSKLLRAQGILNLKDSLSVITKLCVDELQADRLFTRHVALM